MPVVLLHHHLPKSAHFFAAVKKGPLFALAKRGSTDFAMPMVIP